MGTRIGGALLAGALWLAPLASRAQELDTGRVVPAQDGGAAFLLSARLLAPWLLSGGDVEDLILGSLLPASIPRFVLGAQIGSLGIGLGINYVSTTSEREESDYYYYGGGGGGGGTTTKITSTRTTFLVGPTLSYRVLTSPTGSAQLHLVAAFVYGSGGSEETVEGDTQKGPDNSALGVNGGVMGRAILVDGFGLDAGVGLDYMQLSTDDRDTDTKTSTGVIQLIGFIGATFMIAGA